VRSLLLLASQVPEANLWLQRNFARWSRWGGRLRIAGTGGR
jgi:hypothetical protein